MIDNNNFCDRLAEVVGKENAASFAKKSGVVASSIGKYLKGISEPTLGMLIKMANAGNVRVGWLANGELPKELDRPAVQDQQTLDLLAEVERISSGECKSYQEALEILDKPIRKIYQLPVRNGANRTAEPIEIHNPAALVLDKWLAELARRDPIRAAEFLSEMKEAFPDLAEWIKKETGGNHQVVNSQPKSS